MCHSKKFPPILQAETFLQRFKPLEVPLQLRAASIIAYHIPPPHTMKEAILDPIRTAICIKFTLSACALFSKTWIEVSGSGPRDIAKQLKDQQMARLL